MLKNKNIYIDSIKILKDNISRILAIAFYISVFYCLFYFIKQLLTSLFNLKNIIVGNTLEMSLSTIVISVFLFIFATLVITPIDLGIRKWFFEIIENPKADFSEIFEYFSDSKKYIKSILVKLNMFVRIFCVYLLVLVPLYMCKLLLDYPYSKLNLIAHTRYTSIFILLILASIVGLICSIYFSLKYYLVYYLFFEKYDIDIKYAIQKSKEIMAYKNTKVVKLYLMLIPCYLLCFLALPLVFMLPYTYVLTALKAKQILNTSKSIEELNKNG